MSTPVTIPNKQQQSQDAVVLDKIQRFLRLTDGKPFFERLEERRSRAYSSLRSNSELIEVGRSQGRIEILEWIMNMKEE